MELTPCSNLAPSKCSTLLISVKIRHYVVHGPVENVDVMGAIDDRRSHSSLYQKHTRVYPGFLSSQDAHPPTWQWHEAHYPIKQCETPINIVIMPCMHHSANKCTLVSGVSWRHVYSPIVAGYLEWKPKVNKESRKIRRFDDDVTSQYEDVAYDRKHTLDQYLGQYEETEDFTNSNERAGSVVVWQRKISWSRE